MHNVARSPSPAALRFLDGFLPAPQATSDPEALVRARLTASACLASAGVHAVSAIVLWVSIPHVALGNAASAVISSLLVLRLRSGASPVRVGHALIALLLSFVLVSAGVSGGDTSTALFMAAILPGAATLLCGPRAGFGWSVMVSACVIVLWMLRAGGFPFPIQIEAERSALAKFPGVLVLMLGITAMILLYEQIRRRTAIDLALLRRASLEAEQAHLRLERRMLETQRLESLGVLAGGVAHDFNNLLTVILGNASVLGGSRDAETANVAEEIVLAAEQAAGLTDQLLAYAGRSQSARAPTDLSALVRRIESLLRSATATPVELRFELAHEGAWAIADPRHLQQVALNLVSNASEAIRDRGVVTLRSGVLEVGAEGVASLAFPESMAAGRYAFLEVEDDGVGLDAVTRAHIFDPFFTTKSKGRGLGLSAALGIVRSHQGAICVDSAPGRGTRVRVLLPAAAAVAVAAAPAPAAATTPTAGTALVVDDEEPVRRFASGVLRGLGFTVHEARDGEEALRCVDREPGLDLVLLDATMPRLSGDRALAEIHRRRPGLPVILSTGDVAGFVSVDRTAAGLVWLAKPYRADALRDAVTQALAPLRASGTG